MDIKQKLKTFVKQRPSNLSNFDSIGSSIKNNLINSFDQKSNTFNDDKNALFSESIKYIYEQHLPYVALYTKQKEIRELQVNPFLTNESLEQEIINSIDEIYYTDSLNENKDFDNLKSDNSVLNEFVFKNFKKNNSLIEESKIIESKENLKQNDKFDPFEHILKKLPSTMDLGFILEEKKRLSKQLLVVNKRVSDIIQKNQSAYNNELSKAIELQEILTNAINICSSGKNKLNLAKKNLTYPPLEVISNYKRREILLYLSNEILKIKSLLKTNLILNNLIIEEEDYFSAVKLCLDCLKIIKSLNHFKCVNDLGEKLQFTINFIEERLDTALSKLCLNFNFEKFLRIKKTFNLLDKTQFLYDQTINHFVNVVDEKAFNIVNSYVELCSDLNKSFSYKNTSKNNFDNVCNQLTADCFLPCLIDLNKSFWVIMMNYKNFYKAHKNNLNNENYNDCKNNFIDQKLNYGQTQVWQEIEKKLIVIVNNHNLSIYSFDDFISMLNVIKKIIKIGHEFSGLLSENLEKIIKKITSEYFYVYHKNKMEEIKVFLETELWECVPLKTNFSINDLHEFKFLLDKDKYLNETLNESFSLKEEQFFENTEYNLNNIKTPFDVFINNKNEEKYTENKIIEDEINLLVEENEPSVITNSSLNILRIIGKYMQTMLIFEQIAFNVLLSIFHLFDYYLIGIYYFFGQNSDKLIMNTISNELKTVLMRIESTLIINSSNENEKRMRFFAPEISDAFDLENKNNLFGLSKRMIGVESLVYLAALLKSLYDPLMSYVNETDSIWLKKYYDSTVDVCKDLRNPVYMIVAKKYFQSDQIIQSMEKVNWEVKELMSQHNSYVDKIIEDTRVFKMRENDLINVSNIMSLEASQVLWNQILKIINQAFIDGFSTARKCTPEGRALMQLDYQQFVCKIESIIPIKINKELVNEYIKAYYYTEDLLENLIRTKSEYNVKQLKSLINCTLSDNKKGKQRLLLLIETECNK